LRSVLRASRWIVDLAESGAAGLEAAATHTPDIVVLDLTLPDMSGFDVAKELRTWYAGPILVLSVLGSEDDKITALDLGADDYLTKPFLAGELTARLRALLRRAAPGESSLSEMVAGDLEIDFAKRTVAVREERVHLTRTEFDILALLARNADRVVTSKMLLEQVWGPEYVGDTQTLRTHVSHLRRKIERPGDVPRHILTEPGVGFRFVAGSMD
jgi:two-component system KDP operon response regulator KdpE